MRARLTKLAAALAALAALAIGGSALASAGSPPAKAPVVQPSSEIANVLADEPAEKGDTDSIQDESGKDDASEPAGAPENEAAESGSEVPGDDGPGGTRVRQRGDDPAVLQHRWRADRHALGASMRPRLFTAENGNSPTPSATSD